MTERPPVSRLRRVGESLLVLGVVSAYFAGVFQLRTGAPLRAGLGDWIDPYFINSLLEHWYHSLVTLSDPFAPLQFYPARTLGYSHGLILYAPFYVALRPFLHPFLAETGALALVLIVGSFCLFHLFRRRLGLSFVEAALLSAAFWSSKNVINATTGIWAQRASVFLIPTVACMGVAAARGAPTGWKVALAWFTGLTALLLFTQDFYSACLALVVIALLLAGTPLFVPDEMGQAAKLLVDGLATPKTTAPPPSQWWIAMAAVLGAGAVLVWIHPVERIEIAGVRVSAHDYEHSLWLAAAILAWYVSRRWHLVRRLIGGARALVGSPIARRLGDRIARERWRLGAAALGAAMATAIFLGIYLGSFLEHPRFSSDELDHFLKATNSSVWTNPWPLAASSPFRTRRPFALVLAVCVAAWLPGSRVGRRAQRYAIWLFGAATLIYLIPWRSSGVWKFVFAPWPGLGAIRDPIRIIESFDLAVVVVAALYLAGHRSSSTLRVVVGAALIALLAFDWNDEAFGFQRSVAAFDAAVEAPITIDPSCRSFFLTSNASALARSSGNTTALYGGDGLFIATKYGIPALNGYSAWEPPGWRLRQPLDVDYLKGVEDWITMYDLRGVCALDLDGRTMVPYRSAAAR